MKATAIIGANFGDEGKGLMTDYLAHLHPNSLVVRFNGGAQAGHTVVTPEGQRHVFHHFGSGSLVDAPTYLTNHFILNPVLFVRELQSLHTLGEQPIVGASLNCHVTTLADMMLNQWAEEDRDSREENRHGSCGLGVNETVTRHDSREYAVASFYGELSALLELNSASEIMYRLDSINRLWVPQRARKLGIKLTPERMALIDSEDVKRKWVHDFMLMSSCIRNGNAYLKSDFKPEHIIFEGAQGLSLDQRNSEFFPFLTRSNTGSTNILEMLGHWDIDELDVVYVTRAYGTRHGAGPMPNELACAPYLNVFDGTNLSHPFQGKLRYSYLDLDLLQKNINRDTAILLDAEKDGVLVTQTLAITHLDQVGDGMFVHMLDGQKHAVETEDLVGILREFTFLPPVRFVSHGPTRETITELAVEIQVQMQKVG